MTTTHKPISRVPSREQADAIAREVARHGPHARQAGNSRRPSVAPSRPSAPMPSAAETHYARTQAARRDVMQKAIAGDGDARDHLRTEAQWFYPAVDARNRDPRGPVMTDAQIVAACHQLLGTKPAASTSRSKALGQTIDAAKVYDARNGGVLRDVSAIYREMNGWHQDESSTPRSFAEMAAHQYGGSASDTNGLIGSSARGGR